MKEGWKIYTLGELCEMRRGLTYSKNDEADFSSNVVLRSNNVDLESKKLDFTELKYLKEDFIIPEDRKVQKGSFLICMSNGSKKHLGKVALIDKNYGYAFGGFMGLLVPNNSIVKSEYLWTVLTSQRYADYIKSLSDGAGINNLKYKDIAAFEVPVPPLSEQERIVSYLNAQFAKIDALKANAASQLQAAKDLFQAAINEQLAPQEGWINNKLGDICKISTGKRDANHAKVDGHYRFYTCASQYLMCDTYTFEGDSLILPGNGANVGEVYMYSGKFDAYQRTYVLNHIKKDILHKYLYYYFLYKWKRQGTAKQYGAATNYIIMSNFTDFTVSFPSLPEQERIAARLDAISEKVKALQANYDQTITLCNDLKQALLKSIFS